VRENPPDISNGACSRPAALACRLSIGYGSDVNRCAVLGRRPLASACYHLGSSLTRKPQASKAYTRYKDQAGNGGHDAKRSPSIAVADWSFGDVAQAGQGPRRADQNEESADYDWQKAPYLLLLRVTFPSARVDPAAMWQAASDTARLIGAFADSHLNQRRTHPSGGWGCRSCSAMAMALISKIA
jgi:hypothetical protein